MAEDRSLGGHLGALASKVDCRIHVLRDGLDEYMEFRDMIDELAKEKEMLQQEKERLQHENGEALQAMKEDLMSSKNTLVAARNALLASTEEISRKNNELELLKKKLQEHEANNNRAEQNYGSATAPIMPRGVQTRSMDKRRRLSEGSLGGGAYETEHISQLNDQYPSLVELTGSLDVKTRSVEKQKRPLERQQNCGSSTAPIMPRGVQTRSMDKQRRLPEESLGCGPNETEYTSQLNDQPPSPVELMENLNVNTSSMGKQKRPLEIHLSNDADNVELMEEHPAPRQELVKIPTVGQSSGALVSKYDDPEAVREEMIKGFLKIDCGGRKLGIKEMGELNEKASNAACLAKLPPEEVGAAFHKLYSSWQQQLNDLSWNPFKTVAVDGNCQEIVNADDEKLQELKRAWGEGAHNAVVTALIEMKDYDRLRDRSITYELWNYSHGRKATMRECVEYLINQVKQLSGAKRRKSRRLAGFSSVR